MLSTFSSVRLILYFDAQHYANSLTRQQLLPGQQLQQPRRLGLRHLGQLGEDDVLQQERQGLHRSSGLRRRRRDRLRRFGDLGQLRL